MNDPPKPHEEVGNSGLSVVLAARNESHNLKTFLPVLLQQDMSTVFEVVVTNDASTDDSNVVLTQLRQQFPQLRHEEIKEKTHPGKKQALATSIHAAQHPWLLATDADCEPASKDWATLMLAKATSNKVDIVLGYSPYKRMEGWLNRWIRFEAFYTAVQYLTAALCGQPYMGVGRNLLYKRSLFTMVGGFETHAHLAGGDDDLFVSSVASGQNTGICIDPRTWMISEPASSWTAYRRQKQRHLSVSTSYKRKHQVLLGLLASTHIFSLLGIPVLMIVGQESAAWLLLGMRWLGMVVSIRILSQRLGERDLVAYVPFLDLMLLYYYIWGGLSVVTQTSNAKRW